MSLLFEIAGKEEEVMPSGDKTGPDGDGPRTGRGLGDCGKSGRGGRGVGRRERPGRGKNRR